MNAQVDGGKNVWECLEESVKVVSTCIIIDIYSKAVF
jgi:hypothetical protein